MGAAQDMLSINDRDRIARSLLKGCDDRGGTKVGAYCPFHKEGTPGGAFFYDAEKDLGFCHSCQQSGDLIDLYAIAKGFSIDDPEAFRSFVRDYGRDRPKKGKRAKEDAPELRNSTAPEMPELWSAAPVDVPLLMWREKATKFVARCANQLQETQGMLDLLRNSWGITAETADRMGIGYNPEELFRKYPEWGLPEERNEKGNMKAIHLPRGLVFPVFDAERKLLRIKIRLDAPKEKEPKYKAVKGGSVNSYAIYGDRKTTRIWQIVETERDALKIHQDLGRYGIGGMGVGTARLAPDAEAHALLQGADYVLNSLDNDMPGTTAAWRFEPTLRRFSWGQQYAHCLRWPTQKEIGKDVGDLHGKLDLWEWVAAGLPMTATRACEQRARRNGGGNG